MSEASSEHEHNINQGITFAWSAGLIAMIVLVALFALGDLGGHIRISEVDILAAGSVNAIGLIALGGINAIGVVALGMTNSIGVVSIGGINSVGVIAIGGFNSVGVITIGGVNSHPLPLSAFSATIFFWAPRIHTRG